MQLLVINVIINNELSIHLKCLSQVDDTRSYIIVSRGALIVKRMNTCMLCFLKT